MERAKEGFKLQIEYLKRGDKYKAFCDFVERESKKESPPLSLRSICLKIERSKIPPEIGLARFMTFRESGELANNNYSLESIETMRKLEIPPELTFGNIANYSVFGDIFNSTYSFETWWEQHGKQRAVTDADTIDRTQPFVKPLVENLGESIEKKITATEKRLRKKLGRSATKEEFIARFIEDVGEYGSTILCINAFANINPLVTEFRKKVKEAKELMRPFDIKMPRMTPIEISQEDLINLKRYLRVYDLDRQGVNWKDIICDSEVGNPEVCKYISVIIGDPIRGDFDDEWRVYQRYIQKATKIIKNSEQGIFPGDYQ